MFGALRRLLAGLFIVICLAQLALAQVTFSKGWGPGKRADPYDNECYINTKSLALMLHTLMAELKHLNACGHHEAINYLRSIEY